MLGRLFFNSRKERDKDRVFLWDVEELTFLKRLISKISKMIQCQNKSNPWVVLQINKSVFSHSSFKVLHAEACPGIKSGDLGWSSRKA